MILNSSIIIIVVVALFAFYLIYSQNARMKNNNSCNCPITNHSPNLMDPTLSMASNDSSYPLSTIEPVIGNENLLNYRTYSSHVSATNNTNQSPYLPVQTTSNHLPDLILHGVLITQNNTPNETVSHTLPLFKTKLPDQNNSHTYYVIDKENSATHVILNHLKINNVPYDSQIDRHLPVIRNNDMIEDIPDYPNTKFKVMLYKTY